MTPVRRLLLAPALAVALATTFSACGDDDSASTTTAAAGQTALPPVIADLNNVDGTTVDVPVGRTVDLTGDQKTYKDWTAKIADEKVVTFVAGRDEGTAAFNPGLIAKAAGKSEVTLTNSSSSKTVTFTVAVTS